MGVVAIGGIGHVNLRVRDAAESAAFYCGLFGLEARRPTPVRSGVLNCSSGRRGAGAFAVVLTQGLGGSSPMGMDHFALVVRGAAEVDAVHAAARALGAMTTQPRMYDGCYQTVVFDPDGYKIEVLAEAAEPSAAGDAVDAFEHEPVAA